NNHRAMRYSYVEDTSNPGFEHRSINTLGGAEINTIAPGVMGATVVGGGDDNLTGSASPSTVTNNFGRMVRGSLKTAYGGPDGGGESESGGRVWVRGRRLQQQSHRVLRHCGGRNLQHGLEQPDLYRRGDRQHGQRLRRHCSGRAGEYGTGLAQFRGRQQCQGS